MAVIAYFDETGTDLGSTRVMVGAAVTLDGVGLEQRVTARSQEVAADSSMWPVAEKRPKFVAAGFHHNEDDETVRDRFLETMRTLDFRAHVLYSHRAIKGLDDTDLLLTMYFTLVRNLLRRYAGEDVDLIFETKSELDPYYGRIVLHAVESLARIDAPRPSSASARIGMKPMGGLSVIDYTLAVTEAHIRSLTGSNEAPFRQARFTRVGTHMAHLMDFDTAAHRRKLGRML